MLYGRWWGDKLWTMVPAVTVVQGFLETFVAYRRDRDRSSFAKDKYETIDAHAFGTGTQMGQKYRCDLDIYEFSTPADRQILLQSYEKGQNKGW